MIAFHAIALVLSTVCLATPAWADFQAGNGAYNRNDYATALREWRPQAERGDATPQYTTGCCMPTGTVSRRTLSKRGSGSSKPPPRFVMRSPNR